MAVTIIAFMLLSYLITGTGLVITAQLLTYYDWRRKGKKQVKISDYFEQYEGAANKTDRFAFNAASKVTYPTPAKAAVALERHRIYEHLSAAYGPTNASSLVDSISDRRIIITSCIRSILLWPFWA
ncbi:MAG: hypothetical protein Q7R91_02850 [bacterium]|nr:hypothetical protein [bacterium]